MHNVVMSLMGNIQNCTKPYKYHILSILLMFYGRYISMSFSIYFCSGGIVRTEQYGRKVSRVLNSDGSSMKHKYAIDSFHVLRNHRILRKSVMSVGNKIQWERKVIPKWT